jgi:hypothetical protein
VNLEFAGNADLNCRLSMLDFEAGSQNSLPSIIREEIPMLSLRLCFMYVQNFLFPSVVLPPLVLRYYDCQVTNMWNVFKETITKSAVKHIPQKRTKVKDSRPWINTEIRKNLRKLQRA